MKAYLLDANLLLTAVAGVAGMAARQRCTEVIDDCEVQD